MKKQTTKPDKKLRKQFLAVRKLILENAIEMGVSSRSLFKTIAKSNSMLILALTLIFSLVLSSCYSTKGGCGSYSGWESHTKWRGGK